MLEEGRGQRSSAASSLKRSSDRKSGSGTVRVDVAEAASESGSGKIPPEAEGPLGDAFHLLFMEESERASAMALPPPAPSSPKTAESSGAVSEETLASILDPDSSPDFSRRPSIHDAIRDNLEQVINPLNIEVSGSPMLETNKSLYQVRRQPRNKSFLVLYCIRFSLLERATSPPWRRSLPASRTSACIAPSTN